MRFPQRIAAILVAVIIGTATFVMPAHAGRYSEPALAFGRYTIPAAAEVQSVNLSSTLRVQNVGERTMYICTNWGWPRSAARGQASCTPSGSGTQIGLLKTGEISNVVYPSAEFKDIDGVFTPRDWRLMRSVSGPDRVEYGCTNRNTWVKVSPGVTEGSHLKKFYLKRC